MCIVSFYKSSEYDPLLLFSFFVVLQYDITSHYVVLSLRYGIKLVYKCGNKKIISNLLVIFSHKYKQESVKMWLVNNFKHTHACTHTTHMYINIYIFVYNFSFIIFFLFLMIVNRHIKTCLSVYLIIYWTNKSIEHFLPRGLFK